MNRTPITTALAAAVLLAVTTGCGVEKPAPVVDSADTPASVSSDAPATAATAEAPSEAPEVSPTAAIGDTVSVGDWDVRVSDVALDADAAITKANQFNDAPAGRYVLVSYEATYTGTARIGDSFMDLTWSFTTSDAKVNDQSYVVTPADDSPSEARRGGTVVLDVAFDLPPDLVAGGTLTVEAYDDSFDLVYADFLV